MKNFRQQLLSRQARPRPGKIAKIALGGLLFFVGMLLEIAAFFGRGPAWSAHHSSAWRGLILAATISVLAFVWVDIVRGDE